MSVPSPGRGGGALTLVLGTHCKMDALSCDCRLKEKGGGAVMDPRTLRRGAVRGAFPVGAVLVSLAIVQGKHPGLDIISVLATVIRVTVSGQL